MKKIINEQSMSSIDLRQARDVYKCPFVLGATLVKTNYYTDGAMKKVADKDSKTSGNFVVGDTLMIKKDFTFDVIRDNKIVKSNLKWACSTLNKDVVQPQISADQMKSVDDLIAKYPGMYQKETPTADQLKTGEWKPINLKNKFPEQFKFDYTIYEKGGLRQSKSPQQVNVIKTYTDSGWEDKGGIINPAEALMYNTIDLKDLHGDTFTDSYILVQPISSVDTDKIINELNTLVGTKNFGDKKTCRNIISKYNVAKQKNAPINDAVLNNWKIAVNSCISKNQNFNDLNITKKIIETLSSDTENQRWSLSNKQSTAKETPTNESVGIKNIIRENLIEIREQKNKKLLSESKIIKGRLQFITENVTIKNKKQKDKFCGDLLNEMIYLNSQGYNRQMINEGFFDIIGGIFGKGGEGIIQYFKEYIAKWLVEKLTPFDPKGWVGGTIIRAIGNLPIGDIPKLTDCNYLTKLLSKSLGEEAVEQLKQRAGLEGPFYDILRNAIIESLTETDLGQKLEGVLGSILCPLLSKVTGKMEDAAEKMKEGALSS